MIDPLMHTTAEGLAGTDAAWAADVIARAIKQRNEAHKERDDWKEAVAAASADTARLRTRLAEVTKERDALCTARDAAVKAHREAIAAAEQVTRQMRLDRDAAVRNCSLTQSRYDALRLAAEERDALRAQLDEAHAELTYAEALVAGRTDVVRVPARKTEPDPLRPIGAEGPWKPEAPAFKDAAEYVACLSSAGGAGFDTPPAPIPLEVGQRWVFAHDGYEKGPIDDSRIIACSSSSVTAKTVGDHDPATNVLTWSPDGFRTHHPRLRDPSELAPPKPSLPGEAQRADE